jgi:hypothetical protein
MWFSILLHPLVSRWILSYCVSSCLGSSSCDYIDVSSIILGFCINPLYILVVLVPLFLDLSQECWTVFCIMVCRAVVHTCHWWKWALPCIMSYLLAVLAHYWTSNSSKSSSTSSSTYVSTPISSQCVVLRYLVILCVVILWLCIIVLGLRIVLWRWYLVELRCNLSCYHF